MSRLTTAEGPPTDHANDFAEFLTEFGHGAVNRELTTQLRELVAACSETGRKGSITLRINVKADGKMTAVGCDVKSAKPAPALPGEIFFATDDGGLTREDPRQTRFPARVLDVDARAPRVVKEHDRG